MDNQRGVQNGSAGLSPVRTNHLESDGPWKNGTLRRSLRILMVTARYIPYMGGTEVHTYEVARRLAKDGHDVTVLTTDISQDLPARECLDGVKVMRVPAWPGDRDYYFAPGIYKPIVDGNWDLVHCQGYHTLVAPVAMLAAYRSGIPYVVTFHSGGHSSRIRTALRGVQHWLLRPLLSQANRLIGVSNFETEFFQKRLRLASDNFTTISNGSYLPRHPQPNSRINGTLLVSVGRLERHKGHHRTILALPEVVKHIPDVRLRIIGSGPYESELWQIAQCCGVANRVRIGPIEMAERNSMATEMAEAKLAILLSDYEAQGIAILEALSLGIPALVTHTSGLAELANGGLVRSVPLKSSSLTIASAMLEQLSSPLSVPDISLPSWDSCAQQLLRVYYTVSRSNIRGAGVSRVATENGNGADRWRTVQPSLNRDKNIQTNGDKYGQKYGEMHGEKNGERQ